MPMSNIETLNYLHLHVDKVTSCDTRHLLLNLTFNASWHSQCIITISVKRQKQGVPKERLVSLQKHSSSLTDFRYR